MRRHKPIDEVLLMTAELLSRPPTSSVDVAHVHGALHVRDARRWPPERADEVLSLMVLLVEEGHLRGPKGGPLRGDNRVLDIDVLGVTPKGQERQVSRRCWRRAWRWGGRPAAIAMWGIVAAVVVGVLVVVLGGYTRHWLGLP